MSVETRLEKLESELRCMGDRDEIWRLITRYARAVDEEIDSELSAIFTPDAISQTIPWSDGAVVAGKQDIVKTFKGYQRRFENRKRFITNEQIDITGPDSATAWANWLTLHANAGDSYLGWGCYDWDFTRVDGAWLISKMVITVECMTTLENGWGDAATLLAPFPEKRAR
jgi:ketosteroid isomerase-like protein